jgi:hypothetical protein
MTTLAIDLDSAKGKLSRRAKVVETAKWEIFYGWQQIATEQDQIRISSYLQQMKGDGSGLTLLIHRTRSLVKSRAGVGKEPRMALERAELALAKLVAPSINDEEFETQRLDLDRALEEVNRYQTK